MATPKRLRPAHKGRHHRPAQVGGPMADRRTRRVRTRGAQEREALRDESPSNVRGTCRNCMRHAVVVRQAVYPYSNGNAPGLYCYDCVDVDGFAG